MICRRHGLESQPGEAVYWAPRIRSPQAQVAYWWSCPRGHQWCEVEPWVSCGGSDTCEVRGCPSHEEAP